MPAIHLLESLMAQLREVATILKEGVRNVDRDMAVVERLGRKGRVLDQFLKLAAQINSELTTDMPADLQPEIDKALGIPRGKKRTTKTRGRSTKEDSPEKTAILKAIAQVAMDGADLTRWTSTDTDKAFSLAKGSYPEIARRRIPANVKVVRTRGGIAAILAETSEKQQEAIGRSGEVLQPTS